MPQFPWKFGARNCSYDETLSVSGAGNFTMHYRPPYMAVLDEGTAGSGVLKIYDMTNAIGPVLKSTTSTGASTKPRNPRLHVVPGYGLVCLVPCNQSKKLQIYNLADVTAPSLVSTVTLDYAPYAVAAIGTKACVAYFDSFLQTKAAARIDISTPGSAAIDASYASSKLCSMVEASADHFFLTGQGSSGGSAHITALRASDFAFRDSGSAGGPFSGLDQDIVLNKSFTRALVTNGGNGIICAWDISNPGSLSLLGTSSITPAWSNPRLAWLEDKNRMYVGGGAGGGLKIIIGDTTNLAAITSPGNISTSSETVTDITLIDDGCVGLAWAQGTGAAIHLKGSPPLS